MALLVGAEDADSMLRGLADAARQVGWISREAWGRLESGQRGPSGRIAHRDRRLDEDVVLRDGRVALTADAPVTVTSVLRVAAAAAEQNAAIDRSTLTRLGEVDGAVPWTAEDRAAFFRLLRAGRPLDRVGDSTCESRITVDHACPSQCLPFPNLSAAIVEVLLELGERQNQAPRFSGGSQPHIHFVKLAHRAGEARGADDVACEFREELEVVRDMKQPGRLGSAITLVNQHQVEIALIPHFPAAKLSQTK